MIITREILEQHGACKSHVTKFSDAFPDGCPVPESSEDQIKLIVQHEVVRANWAWAVDCKLIPAWSMHGANLVDADLFDADVRGAKLVEADVRGADLRRADLREADLRWANLRGAKLVEADVRGAKLVEADLRGADLPYGFDPEAAGAIT